MTIPTEPVAIPERVRLLARGAALSCLWANELGGLTFLATAADGEDFVIKWGPRNQETSMRAEAERLRWAQEWIRVPTVIDQGEDDDHEWLVTAAVQVGDAVAQSAVAPRWLADPATAVRAVGEGLRAMHDSLPVRECPWEWSVTNRIAGAAERAITVPDHLREAPPPDRLVVCHGDACCPNTLMGDGGRWVAHVDLTRPDPRACTASAIPRRSMLGCRNRVGSRFSRWCGGSTR
ncbi:MAG TPA: phosphotransferase [Gordonia sp. (in: high G+C Gram-positive bacteria)]|uniref:phosphotransferase n=1 Tax=unclassified Gordonia (in: high G+C Gram-positive bacteria) TaxID=2657482 RepID=UPI000FB450A7|nr:MULTISPECIES: phosphotransferase [unclassified Gordonia (in: high G+C Gram-positive bacteria)]RUP36035.1 MAG: aminoglycoside 3'-phosphotransferase [Gordonia sp. (in: high G+C Gram-positive bacteria)]HNP57955.1 phosphotransferase [Gordonia sp. (in: high G+C Gram-positive bacteria)]HRC49352.1 phosphotransferase [Gordonia sp. (in: high G+C Gram-positive bacteria)]